MKNGSILFILFGFLFLLGTVGAIESDSIAMGRTLIQCGISILMMLTGYLGIRYAEVQHLWKCYRRQKARTVISIHDPNRPMIGFVK